MAGRERGTAPTYEGTLKHHGLSDDDLESECSDDFLFSLSKKLVRWQLIDLELDRSVISGIAGNRMEEEGKRQQVLERWKEKFGHRATYGRLVRSFIKSDMANLADVACREMPRERPSTSDGLQWPTTDPMHFTSQRGPPGQEETEIKEEKHKKVSHKAAFVKKTPPLEPNKNVTHQLQVTEQERGNSEGLSDMVTPQISVTPNDNHGSTNTTITKVVDVLHQVTSMLSSRDEDIRKKKEKVKELKGRKEQVEGYLTEKESKITRLEDDVHSMQVSLAQEKWRQEKAQENLEEKEKRIKELSDIVRRREIELQEEKDVKKEKCEELEQVQTSLKVETAAKEKAEAQLACLSEKLQGLQCQVDRAANEVEITRKEREKIIHVLKWTKDDIVEEEVELNEISDWFAKRYTIQYTILIFLFITVILTAMLIEVWRRCKST